MFEGRSQEDPKPFTQEIMEKPFPPHFLLPKWPLSQELRIPKEI